MSLRPVSNATLASTIALRASARSHGVGHGCLARATPLNHTSFGGKSQPHDFESLTRADFERFDFFFDADCFRFDLGALDRPRLLRAAVDRDLVSFLRAAMADQRP